MARKGREGKAACGGPTLWAGSFTGARLSPHNSCKKRSECHRHINVETEGTCPVSQLGRSRARRNPVLVSRPPWWDPYLPRGGPCQHLLELLRTDPR